MADLPENLGNMDAYQYQVLFKTEHVGLIKDCDPSDIKQRVLDQKIGQFNNLIVDQLMRGGLEGALKMTCHEVKSARIRKLMPWAAATGSFSIAPTAVNTFKYTSSGLLTLHPIGAADATDDINILHAYPMVSLPKSAGDDWRELPIVWDFFPDRTALLDTVPTLVYGYLGTPPG